MTKRKVLVVGAGGAVGCEIVRLLCAGGSHVLAAYRTQRPGLEATLRDFGANPVQLDLNDTEKLSELLNDVEGAIFTPILTVSAKAAALLRKDQHAVFCSSNNAAIDHNAEVYAKLRDAEKAVFGCCASGGHFAPHDDLRLPGRREFIALDEGDATLAIRSHARARNRLAAADFLQRPRSYRS